MKNIMPSFDFENELLEKIPDGLIAGVDEVGRGALAGPIVAAAVIFSDYAKLPKEIGRLDDSKKLTVKIRRELDQLIRDVAKDIGLGEVRVAEIDQLGIGKANILAFERALNNLSKCDYALIDGRKFHGFSYPYRCLEKGESKSYSIAAASIVAKVYRDELMTKLSTEFPYYDWEKNKGYGSKAHIDALKKHNVSPHHRRSFLGFLWELRESRTLFGWIFLFSLMLNG